MFKKLLPWYLLGLVVLSLAFIYGCGSNPTGGGGGGATAPSGGGITTNVTLCGTALKPSGTEFVVYNGGIKGWLCGLFGSDAWALTGQTALTYATVEAYNFANYVLIATTSTDADGIYSFNNIPAGIDVVILVKKTDPISGNRLRLSAVIPNVDQQTSITGEVDARTSLAAEQIAKYLGQDLRVNLADLNTLLASSDAALNGTLEVDLFIGHGIITGEFGDGLVLGWFSKDIIDATPTTTEMDCASAKAMVQDIRDYSLTLVRLTSMEIDSCMNALNSITPEVYDLETYYGDMDTLMQNTMIPSVCANVVNFATMEVQPFFDATSEVFSSYFASTGTFETYVNNLMDAMAGVLIVASPMTLATGEYDIADDYSNTREGDTASNLWKFNFWDKRTAVVTLEQTGSLTTYEYTASGGPKNLNMHGISEINTSEAGARMTGSLTNDDLTNAVSYSFDLISTVNGSGKFDAVHFIGTFESDELSVNGDVNMTNINQDDDHYPLPNNVSFTGMIGTGRTTFEGSESIVLVPTGSGPSADMMIKSFSMNGSLEVINVLLDGSMSADIYQNEYYPNPSHIYFDGGISTPQVKFSGLLDIDLVEETLGGETEVAPSHFIMSGIFSTKVLTLEGAMEGHMAITPVSSTLHTYVQDLSMNGSIKPDILGYNGTVTAHTSTQIIDTPDGPIIQTYPTYVDLDGTFTSEVLSFSGKCIANMGTIYMHPGYPADNTDTYWYIPTVDELNFDGTLTGKNFSMDGKFNGTQKSDLAEYGEDYDTYYYVVSTPESLTFSGKISVCGITLEAGNSSVTFFDTELPPGHPKNITINQCKLLTPSITMEGDFTANMVVNKYDPYNWHEVSNAVTFSGKINDPTTGSSANGNFSMSVSNAGTANFMHGAFPTEESEGTPPNISGHFDGKISGHLLPVIYADISSSQPDRYRTNYVITKFNHGLNTLSGTILRTETNSSVKRTDLDLTNKYGVRANWWFEYDNDAGVYTSATGTIKKSNGDQLATFGLFSGLIRVTYTDGYFETLN